MFAKRYGTGAKVFVALHGWAGSHRDFLPLARYVPDGACWVAVDLPGHGLSPSPQSWREEEILAEITSISEWPSASRLTLIGFCSGAALALLMAERAVGRVERVVMIDPFAYVPWYFRLFLASELGRLIYGLTFRTRWGRRLTTSILQARQGGGEDFTAAFETVDHEMALNWLRFFHQMGRPARFADLPTTVDLICGRRTFQAVRKSVREYCAALPQCRVHVLEDVGHLPLVRGASRIAELVFGEVRQR